MQKRRLSKDLYLKTTISAVPRIIAQIDRNPVSRTYGSFDREFWHYNTSLTPSARKQEGLLLLSLLFTTKHKHNPYYNEQFIIHLINAGLLYWASIVDADGSFSEWYPHEKSYVATAFSLYAITESLLVLKGNIDKSIYGTVADTIVLSADWLCSAHEETALNQVAGALVALYNTFLLTRNKKYRTKSERLLEFLASLQDSEGWFREYGCADIGYLSLAVDYLAKYHMKSNNKQALDVAKNAISFIKWFVHPESSPGGVYGSRNTEYLIPSGFEILAPHDSDALMLSYISRAMLLKHVSIGPLELDDRYLVQTGYAWLQAYIYGSKYCILDKNNPPIWLKKNFVKRFLNAGLIIRNDRRKHIVINLKKGGCYKVFDKAKKRSYSDSGLAIRSLSGKNTYTSSVLVDINKVTEKRDRISMSGYLYEVNTIATTLTSQIILYFFQLTFGRISFVSRKVKSFLRLLLVTRKQKTGYTYTRIIDIKSNKIVDKISGIKEPVIVYLGGSSTYIYVPSSCYFSANDRSDVSTIDIKKHVLKNETITISRLLINSKTAS